MKKTTQELFDLMKRTQEFDSYMQNTREERVNITVSAALELLLTEKTETKAKVLKPPDWTEHMPTRSFQASNSLPAINCWPCVWEWSLRWRKPRHC